MCLNLLCVVGVATYCKDSHTPHQAEEGLTGLLPCANAVDNVGCYGDCFSEFSKQELVELDYEGRAVITAHQVKVIIFPLKEE